MTIEATTSAAAARPARPAVERGRLTWGGLSLTAWAVVMSQWRTRPIDKPRVA